MHFGQLFLQTYWSQVQLSQIEPGPPCEGLGSTGCLSSTTCSSIKGGSEGSLVRGGAHTQTHLENHGRRLASWAVTAEPAGARTVVALGRDVLALLVGERLMSAR